MYKHIIQEGLMVGLFDSEASLILSRNTMIRRKSGQRYRGEELQPHKRGPLGHHPWSIADMNDIYPWRINHRYGGQA